MVKVLSLKTLYVRCRCGLERVTGVLTHYFLPCRERIRAAQSSLTEAFVAGKKTSSSLAPFPWQPDGVLIFEELKSMRGPSVAIGDENDPDQLAPFRRKVQLSVLH